MVLKRKHRSTCIDLLGLRRINHIKHYEQQNWIRVPRHSYLFCLLVLFDFNHLWNQRTRRFVLARNDFRLLHGWNLCKVSLKYQSDEWINLRYCEKEFDCPRLCRHDGWLNKNDLLSWCDFDGDLTDNEPFRSYHFHSYYFKLSWLSVYSISLWTSYQRKVVSGVARLDSRAMLNDYRWENDELRYCLTLKSFNSQDH